MKLSCIPKDLAFALNVVNKAVSPNSTLPVLNNILLKSEAKKLHFSATNLEIAISYWINADIKNEGKVTIPSKIFTSYANLLEDEEKVDLNLEEGWNLAVTSQSSQTKIKGISPEEFPIIPKIEKGDSFKINRKELLKSISETVFSASSNIARPVLTGVLLKVEKNKIKMVTTDSYRLSEKQITLPAKVEKDVQCIVPAKTIFELGKILSLSSEEEVEIHISQNQILFKVNNIEIISRLIDGVFPDYERIIPKAKKTKVEINIKELVKAVKKVSLFVVETNNNIKVSVTNDGKLLVSTDETQIGEGKAEVNVKIEGENNKIALNAQYLLEFLGSADTENIIFEMESKLAPAVFKPAKGDDYIHIIMPLKL